MDLNSVEAVSRPQDRAQIPAWRQGDAPLAGGTWLFSEPQPMLRRLIDLQALGWDECTASVAGLRIGATCPIAVLARQECPPEWRAAPLIPQACSALLASFKVLGQATVGGNMVTALPAGPMIALAAALDGVCTIWRADGGTDTCPALGFVTGPRQTVLGPGDLLRRIDLPAAALRRRAAFRRISLTPMGRSAALLIGTAGPQFSLTITAATPHPVQISFPAMPPADCLRDALMEAVPATAWYDDVHGAPDWRRHVSLDLAEQIRRELDGEAP